MKTLLQKQFAKMKITLFIFSTLLTFNSFSQPPFESYYGTRSTGNDQPSNEFVTCASIDPTNYTYAGVHSFIDSSATTPVWTIRGIRIKADGTRFVTNFDFIQDFVANKNLFPLKIIPFVDNNGTDRYLITGYITDISTPLIPHPFVIQADNNLDAIDYKVFTDHTGFFTDVDQLTNGDLIFAGSTTGVLTIAARSRLGWILRTDNNTFTAQWMRYTHLFEPPSSNSHQDFDIIHDVVVIDDDSAIICGNVSIEKDPGCVYIPPSPIGTVDSTVSYVFIAKINLNDGSFYWQNGIWKNYLAARLALNPENTQIALASNALGDFAPILSLFDRGGNFILSRVVEGNKLYGVPFRLSGTDMAPSANISSHVPFIQNIYYNENDEDIFISGKFMKARVEDGVTFTLIDFFEMPFSAVYDASADNLGITLNLYRSAQKFQPGISNFITYNEWNNVCNNGIYPPFFSASNTLPCLSNCGTDEYVTVTLDVAKDANTNLLGNNKVWIFTNDGNPCHYYPVTPKPESGGWEFIEISNDDIEVVPEVNDFNFLNSNPSSNEHDCDE